jgi:hypothetical protein
MFHERVTHLRGRMCELWVSVIQENHTQRDPQKQQSQWLQLIQRFQG